MGRGNAHGRPMPFLVPIASDSRTSTLWAVRLVDLEHLSGFDLFAIYKANEAGAFGYLAKGLTGVQVVELVLGEHFLRLLRRRLLAAVVEGHRHLLISLHPQIAFRMALACVNRPRMAAGQPWQDLLRPDEDLGVAEINLHTLLAKLVRNRPEVATGSGLVCLVLGAVLGRVVQGHCRCSLLLPAQAVAELTTFVNKPGPA